MNTAQIYFSWFDVMVVVIMLAGFFLGRRNGLSGELLPLMKWLSVIVLGRLYYEPLGDWFSANAQVTHNYANIVIYVTFILGVWLVFMPVKKLTQGTFIKKDSFGRLEKPLGMIAGAVHFLCGVFIGIVVLNTAIYEPAQIAAPLSRLQHKIIFESATGLFVRQHLSMTLIEPVLETSAAAKTASQRHEEEINEVMQSH